MKTLKLALIATLATSTLTGCSSLPAGCDTSGTDISDSLNAQSGWQEWSKSALNDPARWMGFNIIDEDVMNFPNCFDHAFVTGYEHSLHKEANWDDDPNYGASKAFLPVGRVTQSVTAPEITPGNNPAALKAAFASVASTVEESSDGFNDYSIDLNSIGSTEYIGEDSNRERDKNSFSLSLEFSAYVKLDKTIRIMMTRTFDNNGIENTDGFSPAIEGLCNGMLIEASGEALKIESDTDCGYLKAFQGKYYFDLDTDYVDEFNGLDHMLKVMATGPFSIFMVDDSGAQHEFKFNTKNADALAKNLLILKAIESGYGY